MNKNLLKSLKIKTLTIKKLMKRFSTFLYLRHPKVFSRKTGDTLEYIVYLYFITSIFFN